MFTILISFGHSASQAPVFEQLPKPTSSIFSTIALTLSLASIRPWGKRANWEILADTNNIAEAFLQAATQAPQPIQIAESKASSDFFFCTRIELASGAAPLLTEIYPPAIWILSKADLSTIRSLITGNGLALQGSIHIVSPSLKYLIERLQVVIAGTGP